MNCFNVQKVFKFINLKFIYIVDVDKLQRTERTGSSDLPSFIKLSTCIQVRFQLTRSFKTV